MAEFWETLLVERIGAVVTITMNLPERKNAANGTMWGELGTVFDDAAADRDVRAMVLTGAGGAFCSGADVSDPSHVGGRPGGPYLVQMRALGELALRFHIIPKPTIAKVGGVADGAGMSLALGCDLVMASTSACFSQIFAKRALSIGLGSSWLLPRLIGLNRAKQLAFFADILSAAEAESFGLVNRVVTDDELDAFVADWATRLAEGPTLALSMTKSMLNNSMAVSMEQALEDESRSQTVNVVSRDSQEALAAFGDRWPPTFEGR